MERLDGEVVGVEHGHGSASKVTTARSTTAYLGQCDYCVRPVRADLSEDHGKLTVVRCPDCGKELAAERLVAVTTTQECDASCKGAYRRDCSCACGGVNHARLWGMRLKSEEMPESEVLEQLAALVKFYHNQVAALQRKAEKEEADSRARTVAFNAWIEAPGNEELVYAIVSSEHPGLTSIKALIDNNEIPSWGQIYVAKDVLAKEKSEPALEYEFEV